MEFQRFFRSCGNWNHWNPLSFQHLCQSCTLSESTFHQAPWQSGTSFPSYTDLQVDIISQKRIEKVGNLERKYQVNIIYKYTHIYMYMYIYMYIYVYIYVYIYICMYIYKYCWKHFLPFLGFVFLRKNWPCCPCLPEFHNHSSAASTNVCLSRHLKAVPEPWYIDGKWYGWYSTSSNTGINGIIMIFIIFIGPIHIQLLELQNKNCVKIWCPCWCDLSWFTHLYDSWCLTMRQLRKDSFCWVKIPRKERGIHLRT